MLTRSRIYPRFICKGNYACNSGLKASLCKFKLWHLLKKYCPGHQFNKSCKLTNIIWKQCGIKEKGFIYWVNYWICEIVCHPVVTFIILKVLEIIVLYSLSFILHNMAAFYSSWPCCRHLQWRTRSWP